MILLRYTLAVLTVLSFSNIHVHAQHTFTEDLDQNNIDIRLDNVGTFMFKKERARPGYEFPKGSNNYLVFANSFWFGGEDQDGVFRLAAHRYAQGRDFFPGPFSTIGAYDDELYIEKYFNSIWTVTKEDIIFHIDNFDQEGYKMPRAIKTWPGNGDEDLGVSSDLAPFIDVDGDGIYDPSKGDYPCIKGDKATYIILNESALPRTESGGEQMDIELHYMFYQFEASDFVNNTTFLELTVHNRGDFHYNDFKTSVFMDPDIGFPDDDYIGTLPEKNLSYCYNAEPFDPGYSDMPGYGDYPPAIGVKLLNSPLGSSVYFERPDDSGIIGFTGPASYRNFMEAKWGDGTPFYKWGTGHENSEGVSDELTNFVYTGNPLTKEGWSERNIDGEGKENNLGGRRFLQTAESKVLNSGDKIIYDFAVIVSGDRGHLENVIDLFDVADSTQVFYEENIVNYECELEGTGDPYDFEADIRNELPFFFEITRLDGSGNMSLAVDLHKDTEVEILEKTVVDSIKYKRTRGPIYVERVDTVNYTKGYYVLKVTDTDINSSGWVIERYDQLGGELQEVVEVDEPLIEGEEVVFEDWGIAVQLKQIPYYCADGSQSCPKREMTTDPIEVYMNFDEPSKKWLTGVKHNFWFSPMNWIMSGNYTSSGDYEDEEYDPNCFLSLPGRDLELNYSNLLEGIITSGQMARFSECDDVHNPIVGSASTLSFTKGNFGSPIYHPSVDIVLTADKSKWTRCPVIELNKDSQTSEGNGLPGMLRQHPSVDKDGNDDGTGTGMSWFPGYAIDVETGRRLNIAFGENSSLIDENGNDLIWNPTSTIINDADEYVLGGQHVIYVFGGIFYDMPAYDEGAYIHEKLSEESSQGFRHVYSNISWVMQPLLEEGHSLLETDVRIGVRINKEFEHYVLSDQNDGLPMFSWWVDEYQADLSTHSETLKDFSLSLYPNPANSSVTIEWDKIKVNQVAVFSLNGEILKYKEVGVGIKSETIDVSDLPAGVYVVRAGDYVKKLVIGK